MEKDSGYSFGKGRIIRKKSEEKYNKVSERCKKGLYY